MNKKMYLSAIISVFVISVANAGIKVYNPDTGKEMELESLVDQGIIRNDTSSVVGDVNSGSSINSNSVISPSKKSKDTVFVNGVERDPNDSSRYAQVYQSDQEKRDVCCTINSVLKIDLF